MEDKDIEQYLKERADEVKVKDFSERWEKLKGRIEAAQEVEVKETASETVLATSSNGNVSNNAVRKKLILSLSAVFLAIAVCLAVVLPITLKKNDVRQYLSFKDLAASDMLTADEFYGQIEETNLVIVDIQKFEASSYLLYYTDDNEVVGGKFDVFDEDEVIFANVVFYDTIVESSFEIGEDFKSYNINGFRIDYKIGLNEKEQYKTTAKAVSDSINYELVCLSAEENIESFFNKFFG
ncbi:MAG: hypothetical protein K2K38_06475 [Clostridia bacterium]|nr:hypothetical protein [Clostridia bacterium]